MCNYPLTLFQAVDESYNFSFVQRASYALKSVIDEETEDPAVKRSFHPIIGIQRILRCV